MCFLNQINCTIIISKIVITCLTVQNKKSKSVILLENMESYLMPRISFNQSDAFVQILLIIEPY